MLTESQMKGMTKAQLEAFIMQQSANNTAGLIVKYTDKGGVYIRAAQFVEHSASKGKDYTAGINMGATTAFALFLNPVLLEQVVSSVRTLRDAAARQ